MSAFVVSAAHIATCAAILRETVFEHENAPPSDTDIRMDLAMSNVISVTWRYGPADQQAYAPILASIAGKLDESGYNTNGAELPEATSGVNEACFDDGFTVTDYFEDCRRAKAISYSLAEAFMYLSCFAYQSCEPPGWKGSKVQVWMQQAQCSLGYRLARNALGDRRPWEVREPDQAAA